MTRRENTENLNEIIQELRANIARAESDIRNLVDDRLKLVEALSSLDLRCGFDLLNPCFDNRPTDVSGQHWGVGKACRGCTARALLRDLGEIK